MPPLPDPLPFAELLARCAASADDRKAWYQMYRTYDPHIFTVLQRASRGGYLLSNGDVDIADVCIETWVKLLRDDRAALLRFRARDEQVFKRYLALTARRALTDLMRRQSAQSRPRVVRMPDAQAQERVLENISDPQPDPLQSVINDEWRERFERELRRVWHGRPECERDILICQLAWLGEMSAQEIADGGWTNLSRGGVEKVLAKARGVMQRSFGGPGARSRDLDPGGPDPGGPEFPPEHWGGDEDALRFLAGELSAAERDRRISHLTRCAECRRTLRLWSKLVGAPPTAQELADYAARFPAPAQERLEGILARAAAQSAPTASIAPPAPTASIASPAQPVAGGAGRGMRARLSRRPAWTAGIAAGLLLALAAALALCLHRQRDDVEAAIRDALLEAGTLMPRALDSPLRLAQTLRPELPGPLRRTAVVPIDPAAQARYEQVERDLVQQLARARGGDRVQLLDVLGHLRLTHGRLALAAESYNRAVAIDPRDPEALIGRAIVSREQAQEVADPRARRALLDAAECSLKDVPESSPHYLRALYDRAQIALDRGDLPAAEELLRAYERQEPQGEWTRALSEAVAQARSR
jgi:RNA polymerase sigma factor (sigma-70 family)